MVYCVNCAAMGSGVGVVCCNPSEGVVVLVEVMVEGGLVDVRGRVGTVLVNVGCGLGVGEGAWAGEQAEDNELSRSRDKRVNLKFMVLVRW